MMNSASRREMGLAHLLAVPSRDTVSTRSSVHSAEIVQTLV